MERNLEGINGSIERIEGILHDKLQAKLFGELAGMVEHAGILVFSVYRWATERNFSIVFDPHEYLNDKAFALEKLTSMLDHGDLHQIINELITAQTDVIWLRRVSSGANGEPSATDMQRAKRYVAFLFFDDLLKLCRSGHCCPKNAMSQWGPLVLNLLKSLSLEDYCRIKGYLSFMERCRHSPEVHARDHYADFLDAMGGLDEGFINCGRHEQRGPHEFHLHLADDFEKVERAKMNRADTIGPISAETVSQFMQNFYGFVSSFSKGEADRERAHRALRELYRSGNTRVVTAAEYFLKCNICSLVPGDVHVAIREDCFKRVSNNPV